MKDILLWTSETIYDEDVQEIIEDHVAYLGTLIYEHYENSKKDSWILSGSNIDWRGSSGYKIIKNPESDYELGSAIIPEYDSIVRLFKDSEKNEIYLIISSHDVPTGGTYYVSPYADIDIIDELDTIEEIENFFKEELNLDVRSVNISNEADKRGYNLDYDDNELYAIIYENEELIVVELDLDTVVYRFENHYDRIKEIYLKSII